MSLFGAPSSTAAFGASSAPAFGAPATASSFGAASTPAFGAASTPAFGFGAASSASAFGATSAPAFGFGSAAAGASSASAFPSFSTPAASAGGLFGSATTSTFGAASTPSLFGAASTPSLFGASSAAAQPGSAFGSTFGFGSTSALVPASTPSLFSAPAGAAAPAAAAPQQVQFSTRYEDLPEPHRKALDEIQRKVQEERDCMQRLAQVTRLHDRQALRKTHEEETKVLKSALQAELASIDADSGSLDAMYATVEALRSSLARAVQLYQRAIILREGLEGIRKVYPSVGTPQEAGSIYSHFSNLAVQLPSSYLDKSVSGFRELLKQYNTLLASVEQVAPPDLYQQQLQLDVDASSLQQQLPTVISHIQDYLIRVAALLERQHTALLRTKDAFLRSRPQAASVFEQAKRQREYQDRQSSPAPVIPPASPAQQAAAAGQQQAAAAPSLFGAQAGTPAGGSTPAPQLGAPGGMTPQPFGGFGSAFGGAPSAAQQNTLARTKSNTSGGQRRKR